MTSKNRYETLVSETTLVMQKKNQEPRLHEGLQTSSNFPDIQTLFSTPLLWSFVISYPKGLPKILALVHMGE